MTLTVGELCAGAGMFGLAIASLLDIRTAWHTEVDPAASKVLAVHQPDAPNHGDITAVDWSAVEPVGILCGGIPCQSWSLAGKRKGSEDERDLWPVRKTDERGQLRRGAIDAIRALSPSLFLLENVPGLLTAENGGPFGQILTDLDVLGYAVSWTVVGACRVGACHHRHRLFLAAVHADLLADTDSPRFTPTSWRTPTGWQSTAGALFGETAVLWPQAGLVVDGHAWRLPADPCGAVSAVLPTSTARLATRRGAIHLMPTPRASDAVKGGPNQRGSSGDLMLPAAVQPSRFGVYEASVQRQEVAFGIPAPEPTEPGRRGKPRLAPAFPEWMQGLTQGFITDHVSRNEAIRIAGNGLVWQACAYALPLLPTFRAFVASITKPSEVAA